MTNPTITAICDCPTKDALVCKEHPDCRPSYCKLSIAESQRRRYEAMVATIKAQQKKPYPMCDFNTGNRCYIHLEDGAVWPVGLCQTHKDCGIRSPDEPTGDALSSPGASSTGSTTEIGGASKQYHLLCENCGWDGWLDAEFVERTKWACPRCSAVKSSGL